MRKRPNKNGIEGMYTIPNSCDHCKKPTFAGDDLIVELDKQISYCMNCAGDETIGENEGNWHSHTYNIDEEYNKYYNVSDIQMFENMIGQKIDKNS